MKTEERLKELEEKQDSLREDFEVLKRAYHKQFTDKKEPEIIVPDEIEFYHFGDGEYGIVFNDRKQILYYTTTNDTWNVNSCVRIDPDILKGSELKLVPVKREELKEGDLAFSVGKGININVTKNDLMRYVIILNETEFVYTNGLNATVNDYHNEKWFKVVKR